MIRLLLVATLALSFIGCSSKTGPQGPVGAPGPAGPTGAPGATSLITTTAAPPGPLCAAGGVIVQSGVDANGNGILDDAEVTPANTRAVCNGQGMGTTAGGDLTGTYPSPTLAPGAVTPDKLADGAVTTTKLSSQGALPGQALIFDGSSVSWGKPALFANTVWVSPTGDPNTDGAALIAALATAGAKATNAERVLVRLEPGTYALGDSRLTVPQNVDLQGSGEGALITGNGVADASGAALVNVSNDSSLRDLTVNCNAGAAYCTGVSLSSGGTNLIDGVRVGVSATHPVALAVANTTNFRLRNLYLSVDAPAGIGAALQVTGGFGEADNLKIDATGNAGTASDVALSSGAILRMHGGVLWAQAQNATGIDASSALLYAESVMLQIIADNNGIGVNLAQAGDSSVSASSLAVTSSGGQAIGLQTQASGGSVLIGDVVTATGATVAQGVLISGGNFDVQGIHATATAPSAFGIETTGSGTFTVRQSVLNGSSYGALRVGGSSLRIAGTEVSGGTAATSGVTACPASWNGSTLAALSATCT